MLQLSFPSQTTIFFSLKKKASWNCKKTDWNKHQHDEGNLGVLTLSEDSKQNMKQITKSILAAISKKVHQKSFRKKISAKLRQEASKRTSGILNSQTEQEDRIPIQKRPSMTSSNLEKEQQNFLLTPLMQRVP